MLLDEQEHLAKELVESILAYALGRTVEFSDSDDVAQILAKLKGENFRTRSMIREVALSPLFRSRS